MAEIFKQKKTVLFKQKNVCNTTGSSTISNNAGRWSSRWGGIDSCICGNFGLLDLLDFWEKTKFDIFQSFQWCFGFNKDVPVLNLSINNTKKIFFVAAQIGVLYDFANNRQQLLIGHVNYRQYDLSNFIFYLFILLEK